MNKRLQIPDKDVLVSLYYDKKLTLLEIGCYFGCSEGTVLGWFKFYGIERISPSYRRRFNPNLVIKKVVVMHADRSINKSVCGILRDHARDLIDDPERLSTDFMKNLIGTSESCD